MNITRETIARLCPRPPGKPGEIWDGYVDAIVSPEGQALLIRYGVTTPLRWIFLIATWVTETNLAIVWEDMNYSAERILQVFADKGITTLAEARRYEHNPPGLAERVYGLGCDRMAKMLGNIEKGDGYRFRGCGIEQITGRAAHERMAGRIGCAVDDLALPLNSVHAALIEWQEKGCNGICDADDGTETTARRVRKAINGGTNGLPDFRRHLAAARGIWPPSALYPSRAKAIVRLGDVNDGAKQVQDLLTKAGYPCGAVDGKFGPLTERALAAFQVAHGLPGTGKLDDETWESLKDAAAHPPEAITPERAQLTVDDLRERGSETVASTDSLGRVGRVLRWLGLGGLADTIAGTGGVDAALDGVQRVHELAEQSHSVLGFLTTPRLLLLLLMLGIGWGIIHYAARIDWARLRDAMRGTNLAR